MAGRIRACYHGAMKTISTSIQLLLSAAIILLCLFSAKGILALAGSPFPSPVLGMVLLFVLLVTGIVPERRVFPAASPLLTYMPLLFIPAGAGLVDHLPLLASHWPLLLTVLILVPLCTLALVGHVIQWANRR